MQYGIMDISRNFCFAVGQGVCDNTNNTNTTTK